MPWAHGRRYVFLHQKASQPNQRFAQFAFALRRRCIRDRIEISLLSRASVPHVLEVGVIEFGRDGRPDCLDGPGTFHL